MLPFIHHSSTLFNSKSPFIKLLDYLTFTRALIYWLPKTKYICLISLLHMKKPYDLHIYDGRLLFKMFFLWDIYRSLFDHKMKFLLSVFTFIVYCFFQVLRFFTDSIRYFVICSCPNMYQMRLIGEMFVYWLSIIANKRKFIKNSDFVVSISETRK